MYLLRLVSFLKRDPKWEVHVLCKSGRLGTLEEDYWKAGAHLMRMRQGYFDPFGWYRLKSLLQKEKYNAVCDFTGNFAGITLWLSYLAGCEKRISFYRHSQEFFKPTKLRQFYCHCVNRLVWRFATEILSNSQVAFDNFFSIKEWRSNRRFEVIPNGIFWSTKKLAPYRKEALYREFYLPPGCKIIGHVSRYIPQKNHKAILDSAEWFLAHRPNVIFLLVGRGVREQFSIEVRQRGLKNIRFAGERRDVGDLLSLMDVFYYPSKTEGQPNALLEAVASRIPFVASNIPEIRSCFPSWWGTKWLVSPDDVSLGCKILDSHLSEDFNQNTDFLKLTTWLRENNSYEKRFGQFLARLEFVSGKL